MEYSEVFNQRVFFLLTIGRDPYSFHSVTHFQLLEVVLVLLIVSNILLFDGIKIFTISFSDPLPTDSGLESTLYLACYQKKTLCIKLQIE